MAVCSSKGRSRWPCVQTMVAVGGSVFKRRSQKVAVCSSEGHRRWQCVQAKVPVGGSVFKRRSQ